MPHFTGNSNFCLGLLQHRDRLAVVHALELGARRCPASCASSPLSIRSSKNGEIVRRVLQQCLEEYFNSCLGQRRVVAIEIGERDLRLDHPELRQVPAGVGVLRAERRPERVDLAERADSTPPH